jgi:hypothetical protein
MIQAKVEGTSAGGQSATLDVESRYLSYRSGNTWSDRHDDGGEGGERRRGRKGEELVVVAIQARPAFEIASTGGFTCISYPLFALASRKDGRGRQEIIVYELNRTKQREKVLQRCRNGKGRFG